MIILRESDWVCSFVLAKRLKELGVSQDSLLVWASREGSWFLTLRSEAVQVDETVAAFTVGELGKKLPCFLLNLVKKSRLGYWRSDRVFDIGKWKKEADARAKMLILKLESRIKQKDYI